MLTDACWALSYLSDGTNDKIQEVIQAGVCRRLVELLLCAPALTYSVTQSLNIISSCVIFLLAGESLASRAGADSRVTGRGVCMQACLHADNRGVRPTDAL